MPPEQPRDARTNRRASTPARKVLRTTAGVVVACVVTLSLVEIVLHRRFRARIDRLDVGVSEPAAISAKSGLPIDVVRSIGAFDGVARVGPPAPGEVRVLALGDSFTFGAEVDPRLSFPSLLEEQFRDAAMPNVKVINLGSNWHSLSQQHRIWDRFGRTLAPDFLLVGPHCSFAKREETFNHTDLAKSGYLHGRYFLDDAGSVTFADMAQATLNERIGAYFGLIPPRDVLRFDRAAPAFIASWSPAGKTIANPFYYTRMPPAEEHSRLSRALLSSFSRDDDVILVDIDPPMIEAARGLPHLTAAPFELLDGFFATRTNGHFSGPANRVVATVYRKLLGGESTVRFDWLKISDGSADAATNPIRFEDYNAASIRFGSVDAGALMFCGTSKPDCDAANFRRDRVKALLVIAGLDRSAFDFPFVLLDELPPIGKRFSLSLDTVEGTIAVESTPLALLHPRLPIGVIRFPELTIQPVRKEGPVVARPNTHRGRLDLGGGVVLEATRHDAIVLQRSNHPVLLATARYETDLDPARLPPQGDVTLVLHGAPSLELTVGRFQRVTKELAAVQHRVRRLLRAAGDHAEAQIR